MHCDGYVPFVCVVKEIQMGAVSAEDAKYANKTKRYPLKIFQETQYKFENINNNSDQFTKAYSRFPHTLHKVNGLSICPTHSIVVLSSKINYNIAIKK